LAATDTASVDDAGEGGSMNGLQDVPALLRAALTDHAQGRVTEAEALYRRLLQIDPQHAQALGLLGLILSDRPDEPGVEAEAEALLRRHLAVTPDAGSSLLALGRIAARGDREDEAVAFLERAARALPRLAPAHNDLGACLHRLGRQDEALEALDRAVALDPAYGVAHANRGLVLVALRQYEAALHALLAALKHTPLDASAFRLALLVQVAQAARKAHSPLIALEPLRAERVRQPDQAELLGELALTLEDAGFALDARALRNDLARRTGLRRAGKTDAPAARMLILGAVGGGHTPTRYLVDDQVFETLSLTLLSPEEPGAPLGGVDPAALQTVDVVFSTLGDVDHDNGQFAAAEALIARLGKPVLNPPAAIAQTGRDRAWDLFAGIEDLIVPKVERCDPAMLAGLAINRPLLARPAGDHGGDNLVLLNDAGDKAAYLASGPAERLLLTPFHNFRSPDGYWRKYRLIFVDRQVFPYHLAIGEHWLTHYWRAEMGRSDWKRAEEARFLSDWRAVFGERAAAAAEAAARRLNLDYGGMDCALTGDGALLLFEANACVLLHLDEPKTRFDYKHRHVPPIRDAFTRLTLRRAGKA